MRSVKDEVRNQILDRVRNQTGHWVWSRVEDQVLGRVWRPVWNEAKDHA